MSVCVCVVLTRRSWGCSVTWCHGVDTQTTAWWSSAAAELRRP